MSLHPGCTAAGLMGMQRGNECGAAGRMVLVPNYSTCSAEAGGCVALRSALLPAICRMLGGGGVDGAIHRAAGPGLLEACREVGVAARNARRSASHPIPSLPWSFTWPAFTALPLPQSFPAAPLLAQVPEVRRGVRCPTGEARITAGAQLAARHVLHTVGPIYDGAEESAPLLAAAYRNSLRLANEQGLKSIAFPAISCGVYGYPYDEAAEVGGRAGGRRPGGCARGDRWPKLQRLVPACLPTLPAPSGTVPLCLLCLCADRGAHLSGGVGAGAGDSLSLV